MNGRLVRTLATAFAALAGCASASAQAPWPVQQQPPSQACQRLESQLVALDRNAADPTRADQIRRYEDAAAKQQAELDRSIAQARRTGCERSGFFLFGGGTGPQCDQINAQIQRMRANLAQILADMQRLESSTGGRDEQRRAILMALGDNNCGPQYRAAAPARPGNFLESLFGTVGPARRPDDPFQSGDPFQSSTYKTVCVRTCDGFYWPISYATMPSRFRDDERTCQRMCPATEVALYAHPNPGGEMSQAISINGQPYSSLPSAFRYRQQFDASCTCKAPGQSWAEAIKGSDTIERGDVVVTDERAKALSQPRVDPRPGRTDTKRGKSDPRAPASAAIEPGAPTAAPVDPAAGNPGAPSGNGPVRAVGPTFYPPIR